MRINVRTKFGLLMAVSLLAGACGPAAQAPAPTAGTAAKPGQTLAPAATTGTAPQAAPAAGPREKLVVTSGGACICHAPLYVGMEKGIFAKYGLDIEVKRVASGFEGLSALQTGDAQVADAVVAVVAQAAQQGVEATAVLMANGDPSGTKATDEYFAVIARKEAGVGEGKLQDLKGKKVGVPRGTVGHQYLHYALQAVGMDSETDVQLQNVGPADLAAALQSGSVDAIASWEPTPLQAKALVQDSVTVYRGGKHMDYLFMRWMSPKFVRENPTAAKSFVLAFAEAAQYTRKNQAEAVDIVAKSFQGLDKGIIRQSLGWLTFDMRYSKASDAAVQQGLDFARAVGALKGDYDFSRNRELGFLNGVVKEHPELFSDLPAIPANLELG